MLLLAETITYRAIRKNINKIFFTWVHLATLFTAFVFMPIVFSLINAKLVRSTMSVLQYRHYYLLLYEIRFYLFWCLLIAGHAFFITTIVNIFGKKDTPGKDNEQPPGILDGILDEY
jgi:hypothetical protein